MSSCIDMHIHTVYSDGKFTPQEVISYAYKIGLTAVGITDHDTTDGINEALIESNKLGIEVIPGVELSAEIFYQEIHLLGYFVNYQDENLQHKLALFRQTRQTRAEKIMAKLQNLGIEIDRERFKSILGPTGNISRLHFARILVEQKYTSTIKEAFAKYLSYGRPAYVPKYYLSPEEAIKIILQANGIPVLAHPYYGKHIFNRKLITHLVKSGLQGIEVWHSKHSAATTEMCLQIVKEFNLLMTGGSDCHGEIDTNTPIMGTIKVPHEVLTNFKIAISKI